jgi:hypothetical protein
MSTTRIIKTQSEQRTYTGNRSRGLLGFTIGLPLVLACFVAAIATWGNNEDLGRLFFVAGLIAFAWFVVSILRLLLFVLSGDRDVTVTSPTEYTVVED